MQKTKREAVSFSSTSAGFVQGSCTSCTRRCASLCSGLGSQCPRALHRSLLCPPGSLPVLPPVDRGRSHAVPPGLDRNSWQHPQPHVGCICSCACSVSSGHPGKMFMYQLKEANTSRNLADFHVFSALIKYKIITGLPEASKAKSRVTPLSFLALHFLACSVPCAINHPEVFCLPVPVLTTG